MFTAASSLAIPRNDLLGACMDYDPTEVRYISQDILTPAPVPGESGNWGRIPRKGTMSLEEVERQARGAHARSDFKLDEFSYLIKHYSHEGGIDDLDAGRFAQYFDAEEVEAKRIWGIIRRQEEKRCADALFNETTFPLSGNTGLDASVDWDTPATATPIADVNAAITAIRNQTGKSPNTIIFSDRTWRVVSQCSQILSKIQYTMQETRHLRLRLDLLADAFGLRNVFVGDAMYDSANKGLAASPSEVWSNLYAFVCYVAPEKPNPKIASIGHTFHWTGPAGQAQGGREGKGGKGLMAVSSYRDEPVSADILRAEQSVQAKIVYPELGFLIKVDT